MLGVDSRHINFLGYNELDDIDLPFLLSIRVKVVLLKIG